MKNFTTSFFLLLMLAGVFSAKAQFQYLGSYDGEGRPDYIIGQDVVSQDLMNNISASLPEGYPVPIFNPHLISSGFDTDIILQDSAEVWVTFVEEGAGYRNVLGFYTYDVNNPLPQKPANEDITIIFPNVSKVHSGGGLQTGDRVSIGHFSAGTGIGWVLFANGWNGSQVTTGHWSVFSNPDFNPEALATDRYHNVLLKDEAHDLIVLGFEDIRRDYASCDQDFNDAIFYVTASPYTAIVSDNYAPIADGSFITSGNEGGLESNGDLASAIAARNHLRAKMHTAHVTKQSQPTLKSYKAARVKEGALSTYFPDSGFYSHEEVRVSTPEDLLSLTNATEVFAADYYEGENRLAAALATVTEGSVYNHNKNICDRLNGAAIRDIRAVNLQGQKLIYSQIDRDQDVTEFATWFSARKTAAGFEIISLWNIDSYPEGDYYNFQIWGTAPAHIFFTANHILNQLAEEDALISYDEAYHFPSVFVKSASYQDGSLQLIVDNKQEASSIVVEANIRRTEFGEEETIRETVSLSGAHEELVTLSSGYLFDAGVSIVDPSNGTYDAVYLADGAWGIDYDAASTTVNTFQINPTEDVDPSQYLIERGFEAVGSTASNVNIFRNLKAGNGYLDISAFGYLNFELTSDVDLEIVIVEKDLEDWSQRMKYTVKATEGRKRLISLDLTAFDSPASSPEIQSIVFSYINTSGAQASFDINVANISFGTERVLSTDNEVVAANEYLIYPNPCVDYAYVRAAQTETYTYKLIDVNGRLLQQSDRALSGETKLNLNLNTGFYKLILKSGDQTVIKTMVVK